MSFRRNKRGRKGAPKAKKKWQLELSSDEDGAAAADGEVDLGASYACKECKGDKVVLACISCTGTSSESVYFCKECFLEVHAEKKDTAEHKKSDHQYRLLMGEDSDKLSIFVGEEVTAKGNVIKRKLTKAKEDKDEDNRPAKKSKGKEFAWMSSSEEEEEAKPPPPKFDPLTRDARSVYIAGLQSNISSATVRHLFSSQGLSIVDIRVNKIGRYPREKQDFYIEFEDEKKAKKATKCQAIFGHRQAKILSLGAVDKTIIAKRDKIGHSTTPAVPPSTAVANDWKCRGCKNTNYSWRMKCNRCGEMRTDGGVAVPRSYVASPGDWPCQNMQCRNINYARRTACNKCQTPKPAGPPAALPPFGAHAAMMSPARPQSMGWPMNPQMMQMQQAQMQQQQMRMQQQQQIQQWGRQQHGQQHGQQYRRR